MSTVSREKLYEEAWAEPMLVVAARYSVSGVVLAKVCARLRVPVPGRGYWARVAAGKPVDVKPPLPDLRPGDELEWARGRHAYARRAPMPDPVAPTAPADCKPERRPKRHALLVGARELFEDGKVSEAGYLKPKRQLLPDLFCTKDAFNLAAKLASEFYLEFETRGFQVAIAPPTHLQRPEVDHRGKPGAHYFHGETWSPTRPTIAMVGTVAIGLSVWELSERAEVQSAPGGGFVRVSARRAGSIRAAGYSSSWTFHRDLPTGHLCIRAYSPYQHGKWQKEWPENTRGALLKMLPTIVDEIVAAAPTIASRYYEDKRQAEIRQAEEEEHYKRWVAEEARKEREEAAKQSREQLLNIIEQWSLAKQVEAFFEWAEQGAHNLGQEEQDTLSKRLTRARSLLGGIDPLSHFARWQTPDACAGRT